MLSSSNLLARWGQTVLGLALAATCLLPTSVSAQLPAAGYGCVRTPQFELGFGVVIPAIQQCTGMTALQCTTTLGGAAGFCTLWSPNEVTCNDRCSACGNGLLEADKDEQCDDGNDANGDGCDRGCKFEPVYCCQAGARVALNAAQMTLNMNAPTSGLAAPFGVLNFTGKACSAINPVWSGESEIDNTIPCGCGDGVLDPATEECDLGRSSGGINRNRVEYGCNGSCELVCGDEFVDTDSYVVDWYNKTDWAYGGPLGIYAEVCDDGNAVNDDDCDNYCQTCGNNQLDGDEVCDMGRSGIDGHLFNAAYGCNDDCSAFLCGNGTVDDSYVSDIDGTDAEPDGEGGYLLEQCDDGNETSGDGCSAYCQEETGACCIPPENLFFDGQPTAVAETRSACETLAGTWNSRRTVLTRVPGATDPITNEQAQQFCGATVGDKYCCSPAGDFAPFKLDPALLAPGAADCSAYPNGVYNGPFMNLETAQKACKPVYCEVNNCELKPKFDCQIGYGKDWRPPNNSEHQAAMTRLSLPMTAEGFCKYWITPGA